MNIDVRETLRKKLGVDFKHYTILGTCNPPFAYKSLQAEEKIGLMLPCNVVVFETQDNKTEVAAIDPIVSMKAIENPALEGIAVTVQSKLQNVIENL